jgi:hypothetical protein
MAFENESARRQPGADRTTNFKAKNERLPSATPNNSWSDPDKLSDFQYELSIANEPVPIPYLNAHPAFEYIAKKNLAKQLYAALDRFAPLLPIYGFHGITSHWYSPSPAGFGTRVIIVIAKDAAGTHSILGSNWIDPRPKSSGKPVPANLVDLFKRCTNLSEKNALLVKTLNAVTTLDWHGAIDQVESEAEKFRTMPIYLAVVEGTTTAFYCTSARAEVYGHPARWDLETVAEMKA